MKKALAYSLAAVLLLCVGIAVGMSFNRQKNTSEVPPAQEVSAEKMKQEAGKAEDAKAEKLSEQQVNQVAYMTEEDKLWLFQQVYDAIHGMMEGSGASDEEYLFAELRDLPSLSDTASRNFFNNRKAPESLEDEYIAWRTDKYGTQENKNTEPKSESTNKAAETQKPAQTQTQPNCGEVMTENPFANQDRTRTPEQEQKDIEATRKAVEAHPEIQFHAGSGSGSYPVWKPKQFYEDRKNEAAQDAPEQAETKESNTTQSEPEQTETEEGAASEPAA